MKVVITGFISLFFFGAFFNFASACADSCSASGAKQCKDNGYQTCGDDNGDGCLEWGAVTTCWSQTCTEGICSGEMLLTCVDANGYHICYVYENGDCAQWSPVIPCASGKTCSPMVGFCSAVCIAGSRFGCKGCNSDGSAWIDYDSNCADGQTCVSGDCVGSCADGCTDGAKQCSGNGYQTCGDYNSDGCTEWSSVTACANDKICSSGTCINNCMPDCSGKTCGADGCGGSCGACASNQACNGGQCVNNCVAATCASLGDYKCGTWSDGCGDTVSCGSCSGNQTCNTAGRCVVAVPACSDACVAGSKQCSGNGYRTCGKYDSDSCLEWSDTIPCASGKTCAAGDCIGACRNECLASGLKTCKGAAGYQTCGDYDDDGCLEWSDAVACGSGKSCAAGVCVGNAAPAAPANAAPPAALTAPPAPAKTAPAVTPPLAAVPAAPAIEDIAPQGVVYQKDIALTFSAAVPSECRYSAADTDYRDMSGIFDTDDGISQRAVVALDSYGAYDYYVRCKDKSGRVNGASAVIKVEFKNPEEIILTDKEHLPANETTGGCDEYQTASKDSVCVGNSDCVCDPYCPASGGNADSDCANIASAKRKVNLLLLVTPSLFLLTAAAAAFWLKMKKNRFAFNKPRSCVNPAPGKPPNPNLHDDQGSV